MTALLGSTFTAQAQRRFSPEAKGTVIGAGSGAILGAVIDKHNRGVGGIIGGVVGAGAGYAVGKHIDNRQKKRAAATEAEREAAYREEAAHRSAVASRTATRETGVRSYGPAAGVAGATALAAGASGTALTASEANYLPNPAPADPANPYAGSAYRQRSW
ncbi:YMGG-like glycine zipper-containing protein [Hymenobacter sp. BRD67]|uniref:YMGG-like glycine zipper-containing protein n=1 Tax=Hymenobacter sp. BRD67 TaxID=2675877 RepID=UPI0020B7EEAA|nr:YMGG-like glycine zipper-containing protein [Hymenobacter sp. BRD67]